MSSDIIYDVLYQHERDHILIEATRRDAARGLLDIERLMTSSEMGLVAEAVAAAA